MPGTKYIHVNDDVQKGYSYECSQPIGKNFDSLFEPELSPQQMLNLGVFGGNYFNGFYDEFPSAWFKNAKLSNNKPQPELNYFEVSASQSLSEWQRKGWIFDIDPRGWFQWYCRYYLGRRVPEVDAVQIKRWRAFRRHVGQIKVACAPGDMTCRRRQRQALLHWAYDGRKI